VVDGEGLGGALMGVVAALDMVGWWKMEDDNNDNDNEEIMTVVVMGGPS